MKKLRRLGDAGKGLLARVRSGRASRQELERTRAELAKARGRIRNQRTKIEHQDERIARLEDLLDGAPTGALPDFLIIGAAKCGTTAFYGALCSHPLIVGAARKEIHYFDSEARFRKGSEWYASHFAPVERRDNPNTITGEASPRYLYAKEAPARAARVVPNAKLIVLLRNPIERTYSAYSHAVIRMQRIQRQQKDRPPATSEIGFAEFVRAELGGKGSPPGFGIAHLARSVYVDQIERWHEHFDREQLLVLASEEFFDQHTQRNAYAQTLEHLGVQAWQPEAILVANQKSFKEGMTSETRKELEEFFEPHNQRLYEYLGVDFGW
jgi:hypothetical protein